MKKTKKQPSIKQIEKKIIPILMKNGIVKAGLFGSFVRGEATKQSDIDLLIQFKSGKSLFDLLDLEFELEEKLNRKVDIVTYKSLNHLLKDRILHEEVRIL